MENAYAYAWRYVDTTPGEVGPLEQLRIATVQKMVQVGERRAERRQRVMQQWAELPRWRRGAYRLGGVVVSMVGVVLAAQAFRATGTTVHGLEELGMLDGGNADVSYTTEPAEQELALAATEAPLLPQSEEVSTVAALAATTSAHPNSGGYNFSLPANVNQAPETLPLGKYNGATGHGTIWNQTVAYADELGFGDLTERQKHKLTGRVLRFNDLSWADARQLSPGFEPRMPSQEVMEQWLDRYDADRTHAAERPVVIIPDPTNQPPPAPDTTPDPIPPVTDDGITRPPLTSPDCNAQPWWPSWYPEFLLRGNPLYDCYWNEKDHRFLTGMILLAGLSAVGMGMNNRYYARRVAEDVPPPDEPAVEEVEEELEEEAEEEQARRTEVRRRWRPAWWRSGWRPRWRP